ncbi:hypothetical protein O3G_MSEX013118 [Manduca sexta]|uniref:Uncharacterized protein n=1 Tax=Manduca sexta TaxID=7130 RepID=A0A921ZQ69_MANSE|nr:hypothetical protein O3G_MSEX013118 [Manduca sexta]
MLCAAIMTDHWEHVVWDRAALTALANASNTPLQWLLDEKVAKIEDTTNRKGGGGTFLVPMNGGIWTMCVSLEEEEASILSRVGFPSQPTCTNYLADSDYDEPRADWQHRKFFLPLAIAQTLLDIDIILYKGVAVIKYIKIPQNPVIFSNILRLCEC